MFSCNTRGFQLLRFQLKEQNHYLQLQRQKKPKSQSVKPDLKPEMKPEKRRNACLGENNYQLRQKCYGTNLYQSAGAWDGTGHVVHAQNACNSLRANIQSYSVTIFSCNLLPLSPCRDQLKCLAMNVSGFAVGVHRHQTIASLLSHVPIADRGALLA